MNLAQISLSSIGVKTIVGKTLNIKIINISTLTKSLSKHEKDTYNNIGLAGVQFLAKADLPFL